MVGTNKRLDLMLDVAGIGYVLLRMARMARRSSASKYRTQPTSGSISRMRALSSSGKGTDLPSP